MWVILCIESSRTNDHFHLFCINHGKLHVGKSCFIPKHLHTIIINRSNSVAKTNRRHNSKPNENDKNTRYFNHYINQIYLHTFFSNANESAEQTRWKIDVNFPIVFIIWIITSVCTGKRLGKLAKATHSKKVKNCDKNVKWWKKTHCMRRRM